MVYLLVSPLHQRRSLSKCLLAQSLRETVPPYIGKITYLATYLRQSGRAPEGTSGYVCTCVLRQKWSKRVTRFQKAKGCDWNFLRKIPEARASTGKHTRSFGEGAITEQGLCSIKSEPGLSCRHKTTCPPISARSSGASGS